MGRGVPVSNAAITHSMAAGGMKRNYPSPPTDRDPPPAILTRSQDLKSTKRNESVMAVSIHFFGGVVVVFSASRRKEQKVPLKEFESSPESG